MFDKLKFYNSAEWKRCRDKQLEKDHYECQRCKHNGKYKDVPGLRRYTRATLVHHDFRLLQYPEYRLRSVVNGKRNLYSLCQSCHEIEHESERGIIVQQEEMNEEKW